MSEELTKRKPDTIQFIDCCLHSRIVFATCICLRVMLVYILVRLNKQVLLAALPRVDHSFICVDWWIVHDTDFTVIQIGLWYYTFTTLSISHNQWHLRANIKKNCTQRITVKISMSYSETDNNCLRLRQ